MCVCVCVCVCVCTPPTHITSKDSKRKVRGSEGKHPICYNFAWAVPVSKDRDNIFWSKDQRTYGLTQGLTKGKIFEIGTLWDNLRCMATIIPRAPGNHGVLWETLWNTKTLNLVLQTRDDFINRYWDSLIHWLYDSKAGRPHAHDNSKRVEICLHHL